MTDKAETYREPITEESLQSIIDYINEGDPDLKVITGDLGEMILRSNGKYWETD